MKLTRVCFECAQGNASAVPAPSSGFGNSNPCPMCKVSTPDLHGFWYDIKVPVVDANQVESAVAPGECGSVPTVEQVEDVVGMGSNAWDCVPPVALIEAVLWCAGMQPPSNQPNLICKSCGVDRSKEDCKGDRLRCGLAGIAYSDHVAVISAEPDSFHLAAPTETATDTSLETAAGKYLDELDAAQAGWPFILSKVADCQGGRIVYSPDDLTNPMPVMKWCAIFDSHDNLCAAYMLTRDALNRTQLTLVDTAKSGISSLVGRPNEQNDFRCMEIGCGSTTEGVHHHTCPEAAGSQEGK